MPKKSKIRIGITMGDPNGIGPEVLTRALNYLHPFNNWTPLIFGDLEIINGINKSLGSSLSYESIPNNYDLPIEELDDSFCIHVIDLPIKNNRNWELGLCSSWGGASAFKYIHNAIKWANKKKINAVVTAPISKEAIFSAGYDFPGHTEIFSHYSNGARSVMMLSVDNLRASMVTLHMSLRRALDSLTPELILEVIEISDSGLRRMGIKNPKLGIAGLNPHAGENGLFGDEEKQIIIPALDLARNKNLLCEGPFPPDTIFLEHRKGLFDAVVALYHDQALIPLKLYGFDRAVNITLGLPIIRTSPDHGTAFQLAPKLEANPSSMIESIKMALRMTSTSIRV
ncbi:MAG: 4-hydroxythreonine-4-phosphate dehydrogenase PdxA [Deltaproteobacteria bacterium]|nr:4-hydroxythreonine-4-phosphate dehydrogenase PdxA [Deltaproteobacteria bacterium]